jgi:hypothetical protein
MMNLLVSPWFAGPKGPGASREDGIIDRKKAKGKELGHFFL